MQWILLLVGGVIVLLLGLVVAGLLLPRAHVATSWIELPRPPAEVWSTIRDLGQVPTFWVDVKTSERGPDRNGHEVWTQTMKNGFAIGIEIIDDQPPHRLVTRLAPEGKAPFGGSWIYEVAESGIGSRVTLTEDGWVDNPFFRVISRIMGHHATLDSYLRALGRKLGETVTPVHRNK
jgi:uncharacterized protein YndB with AHSA1/START domain